MLYMYIIHILFNNKYVLCLLCIYIIFIIKICIYLYSYIIIINIYYIIFTNIQIINIDLLSLVINFLSCLENLMNIKKVSNDPCSYQDGLIEIGVELPS